MNTITFDDNIVVMKLKDFKNASDSRNRFYKCWRAKIEECENLQSKIDKAIGFIKESNTYYEITHYIPEDEKQFKINMETLTNHLLDILKEDNYDKCL